MNTIVFLVTEVEVATEVVATAVAMETTKETGLMDHR